MGTRAFMVIAGEASGDALASELVIALRERYGAEGKGGELKFFGVGGPKMAQAGVEMICDLAENAVFGLEALTRIFEFKKRFQQLLQVAIERRPDAIICVDFAGFNRRFAHAVKEHVRAQRGPWDPRIIQYVSPQVWASRPRRADKLAHDVDLLLAIFPFEKAWYARRVPGMQVEFVGHPVVDRYAAEAARRVEGPVGNPARLVLLPGSRPSELKRHLPVLAQALEIIKAKRPITVTMVMPENMIARARAIGLPAEVEVRTDLAGALVQADAAIAKSGTITLECAFFGVPTVAMYKTSWATYELARRIVSVKWIAMPNILANEEVFPEFVQSAATPENIARATLELIESAERRSKVAAKLKEIVSSLGEPGASGRAAERILKLVYPAR